MEQDRALRVLEFTKIRERLAAHALTDMGKEKCLALVPYDDISEVRRALDETEEACVLLSYLGGQPLVAFPDVREQVTLAQKGACLSQRALLDVAACLRATRAARSALVRDREDTPILTGLATRLTALDGIENDISAAIISEESGVNGHAATVGLTLGKAVIVGAAGAVQRLKDGAMVSVDCARGVVQTLPQ